MQVKQASSSLYMLQFELDSKWLVLANATFPLTLRNLTFEEIDGFIEVVKVQQLLKVSTRSLLIAQWRPMMKASDVDITYEMRNGYSPYRGKNYDSNSTTANLEGAIVLVHGYCADHPPFPSSHFTNPVVFSDLDKSRTIDAFARLIISFTANRGLQRFSIVAHSQGGMAAVHMLTFFITPLDGMVSLVCIAICLSVGTSVIILSLQNSCMCIIGGSRKSDPVCGYTIWRESYCQVGSTG